MAVCQNLVPLVNIKIAGKWMFIPLKMVLIGIDPYPYDGGNGHALLGITRRFAGPSKSLDRISVHSLREGFIMGPWGVYLPRAGAARVGIQFANLFV